MQLYHLSHIDLDGYTCQFVTSQIFDAPLFFNANYGEEVMVRIDEIIEHIEASNASRHLFLITDLNLSDEEAAYVDARIKELRAQKHIELILLDHHASGIETAQQFSWYHLDVTRSATKITYEHFLTSHPQLGSLEPLVQAVNAVDIWLSDDSSFEMGKVLMRLIDEAKEINRYMFASDNLAYKHYMLSQALPYVQKGDHIALDEALCTMKKSFFKKSRNDTFDNLLTSYILALLGMHKEQMTIHFQGNKGLLTFGIQNTSIVGNAFLQAHPDYHFFMNVNPRGTFSLRADNKMDVSQMASIIAGGGGHPNASGGKLKEFKEFFRYDQLKSFIEELLKDKE